MTLHPIKRNLPKRQLSLTMTNITLIYATFQAVYALVKHVLKISPGKNTIYVQLCLVFITLLLILLLGLVLTVFGLFYTISKAYLKLKHGKDFGEMMTGQDPMWKNFCIHCFISVEKTSYEETVRRVRSTLNNFYESCIKLHYLKKSWLGYNYYLKSHLKLEDFIVEIDCENNSFLAKGALLDYISANIMKPGVLEERTWSFFMFKQPILWSNGTYKYGGVLTVNHCVCDGIALMSMLKNKICDKFEYLNLYNREFSNPLKPLDDAYILPPPPPPPTTVRERSFEQLLTFFIEDEPKYMSIVKELKSKLNVGFNDVLLAGISHAFKEYNERKKRQFSNLRFNYLLRSLDTTTLNMFKGNYDYNKIANNTILVIMELESEKSKNMLETILELNRLSQEYKGSVNILLWNVIVPKLYLLPFFFVNPIVARLVSSMNISVSNVTGIISAETGGFLLQNLVFFVSPTQISDLVLCILTYSNKFHISCASGTDVVDNREDLDEILKTAFRHIELLNRELEGEVTSDGI